MAAAGRCGTTEGAIGGERGDPAALRALQVHLLDGIRLEHVLDRLRVLADHVREVVEADRAAAELLDHGEQQLAVHDVEAERVDVEHLERRVGGGLRHRAVALHLGVVAHAAQQAVGDARRAARAPRDLAGALLDDLDFQQPRRAADDGGELGLAVELEARDDAEAVAQRVGEHAGARGGADQGERRQVELDRARARALADHDVDLEVLERRIKDLLDHRREAMNLVDEEHVPRFQIGQQRGEIAGALEHRAGGLAQVDAHLLRDDVRQGGLAEAGWAEQQDVVERLATSFRRLDEDLELAADLFLPDVLGQRAGPQRLLDPLLFARRGASRDQPVRFDGQKMKMTPPEINSTSEMKPTSWLPTLL